MDRLRTTEFRGKVTDPIGAYVLVNHRENTLK